MTKQMTKKEIAESKTMTEHEKQKLLNELREPYKAKAMSDEELLQLVRDFTEENGREPTRDDLVYDVILKARFGPWYRMLEKAGTRPVAESHLIKEQKKAERKARQAERRRQLREEKAAAEAVMADGVSKEGKSQK